MRNYLKTLIALILALACVVACVACGNKGNGSGNDGGNVVTPPPGDNADLETETYRLRFVYSYTARVANDNGRTEDKNEVVTVKSIYVDINNNGLSAEQLAQIAGLTYNGYSFLSWHADWDKDTQTAKDAAVDFSNYGKITKDLTFYGERGNLAGPNTTWEIVYQYPEVEEEEGEATTPTADTPAEGDTQTPSEGEGETPEEIAPIGATLYIKGTGAMFDFANGNAIDVKWFKDQKLINTVVIQDGITNIGSNSFKNFTKLANVKHFSTVNAETGEPELLDGFPDSITVIGDSAFLGCTALKSLVTPKALQTLKMNAFASTGLKSVILNEGLVTLEQQVFYGSNKIASILIPSTLKTIGNSAFHAGQGNSHNLSKVFYKGDETGYKAMDIAMDNQPFADLATKYYYIKTPDNYGGAGYEEIIGNFWHYADENNELHPVQYCYTISYIDSSSAIPFAKLNVPVRPQRDENGQPIVDEEGVTSLEGTITEDIYYAHKNMRHPNGFTYAGFSNSSNIVVGGKITGDIECKGDRGKILSEYGGITFTCVDGVITVSKDPDAETRIREELTALKKSELKKSLSEEEKAIISDNSQTGNITIEEATDAFVDNKFTTDEQVKADFEAAVAERLSVAFKIWDFVKTTDTGLLWNDGGLAGLSKITKVVINEGVEYIGALTFTSLSSITEVEIPGSVKGVHSSAFSGCSALNSVYYKGNIVTDCPTLNELGENADTYSYVEGTTAEAGNYWTRINDATVAWKFNAETGELYIGGDNVMVDFATPDEAPWYGAKDNVKSVSIANNIVDLGDNIVNGYSNVEKINLPTFLRAIPATAFAGTKILSDTSYYKNNGVLVVDKHLIKVDPARRNTFFFEAPVGIVTIADGAFEGCSDIKRIYLPSTIQRINPDAFEDVSLDYIFTDGDSSYWKSIENYVDYRDSEEKKVDFGDARVLYKSESRPRVPVLDEEGKDTGKKAYADGQFWHKVGNEYIIWGCDHIWTDWIVTKPATCEGEGTKTRFCIYDIDHVLTESIPALEHVFKEYKPDEGSETCVVAKTETATCETCNKEKDTRDILIPKVDENGEAVLDEENNPTYDKIYGDHNYEGVSYTYDEGSITCQNPYGTKSRTCVNCPHVDTVVLEAGDPLIPEGTVPGTHVFDKEIAEEKYIKEVATETSGATYYKSCKWCGEASETETFVSGDPVTAE